MSLRSYKESYVRPRCHIKIKKLRYNKIKQTIGIETASAMNYYYSMNKT